MTGNYHEYAYGPAVDGAGNLWVALNCSIGKGSNPNNQWRGWSLRVKPDGSWSPMSGGFRSPSGIGTNLAGDVFATALGGVVQGLEKPGARLAARPGLGVIDRIGLEVLIQL